MFLMFKPRVSRPWHGYNGRHWIGQIHFFCPVDELLGVTDNNTTIPHVTEKAKERAEKMRIFREEKKAKMLALALEKQQSENTVPMETQ